MAPKSWVVGLSNEVLFVSVLSIVSSKLNHDLISMSLKSNYDVIICPSVSYFLLSLIGWSKAGSTNEKIATTGGAKCNQIIKVKWLNQLLKPFNISKFMIIDLS